MLRRTFRIELARIAYRLIVEYSTMSSTTLSSLYISSLSIVFGCVSVPARRSDVRFMQEHSCTAFRSTVVRRTCHI
jgi:hypothetical protein